MREFLVGRAVTGCAVFFVLATTGARRGEVLGRWSDVGLGASRLHMRRSLVCVTHEPEYSATNTAKSRRTIALDIPTVSALRAHRAAQAAERLAVGETYADTDLVLGDRRGGALHPERFMRTSQEQVARLGLPSIRLHDLRHTWATLALQAGTIRRS